MTLEEFEKKANSFMAKRNSTNTNKNVANNETKSDLQKFEEKANKFLEKRNDATNTIVSNTPKKTITEKMDSLWVESTAPNKLQNINTTVKPVNISDFVKDIKNSEAGRRATLTMETDKLTKQIQAKEQEYNRANNISDWNKKNQTKTEIGQELNALKEKLDATKTSLAELNRPNEKLLTAEQVAENNKNAPLSQKIDKAIKYDIPKTAEKTGRTAMDLLGNVATGVTKGMEGYVDAAVGAGGTALSSLANLAGQKELSKNIKNKAEQIAGYGFAKDMQNLINEKSQQGAGIYNPSILGVIDVRDAAQEIARMYTVGRTGGMPGFMISAAGGNIEEALNEGESLGRATAYGAISGSLEGIVEKMFDPAKILGGGLKTIGKGFLGKIAEATVGEGAEEGITTALNPFVKMLVYEGDVENPFGSWDNFKNYLRDIGQSIYQGAVIGGLTLGVSAPGNVDLQNSFKDDVHKAVEKIQGINQARKDEIANTIIEGATQSENIEKLPKTEAQNQVLSQETNLTNTITPNQAEIAQNSNMEQMIKNAENDTTKFGKQVDDLRKNNFNRQSELVVLENTPQILLDLGLDNYPITIKPSKLETIYNDTAKRKKDHPHDLGELVKEIPEALKRPLNVVESVTRPGSVVVVTDLADKNGDIVIVSINPNDKGQLEIDDITTNKDVNKLTSAYGKREYDYIVNKKTGEYEDGWMELNQRNDKILYDIDEGIIKKRINGQWLKLPNVVKTLSNNSINQNDVSVNTEYAQTKQNDTAGVQSAFSMQKNQIQSFASSAAPRPYMDLNKHSSSDKSSKVSKVSLTDIQKAINDIVPVKVGKFRQQAYGIYKTQGEIIRLKETKDIPVALHELTHHLDKKYNLSSSDKAFSELENIAVVGKNATKQTIIKEGVAEFGRYYMTNKEYAKEIAPFYYETFERALSNDGEMKNKVENIRQKVSDYLEQSPISRLASNIDYGDETVSLWGKTKDTILKSAKNFRKNFVDDLDPLKKIINEISNNDNLPTNENAYELLRLNNGVTGKVRVALEYGIVDDNGERIGKGLKEILEPVANRRDEFVTYITALRANDLTKRDIETGLSQKDIEETLTAYKDDEVFEQTAKELYEFQNQILEKTLVKSGIITKEALENYNKSNPHYVPFYRVMDENFKRSKDSLSKSPKRIKGSTRDIINPLESIIKNVYSYMQISERNDAYNALFDLANKYDGTGKWFDKVPTDMIGTKITANDVKSILEQLNLGEEDVDYNEVFTTMFKPSYNQKGNIVTVMKNGKPTHYEINDKELYDILSPTNTGRKENIFLTLLNGGAKALRVGATHSPEFILRNPLRDTMDAGIYSKNGFIPLADTISGIFEIVGKTDLYYKWLESGGSGSTYTNAQRKALRNTLDSITAETTKKPLTKEERARATLKTLKDVAKHPLRTYLDIAGNLSNVFEEGTRVGEFKKALESTGDAKKSALESRNITVDFSRGGTQARDLNKYIAFLNANIQGLDKIVTSFRERPVATGMKAVAYLTIPSILIRALQDEEKMEKVPQWEKDTYWVFFIGDTPVKIPKPQGLGQAFATIPERVIDFIKTQDPKAFDGLAERLLSSYAPIDSPTSIIPTGGQPLVENATNYSFFRQQPIVKQSLQNRSPKYQYDDSTSTIAKKIGGAINYSPKKIDNLISGYLGNLGKDVANIAGVPFDIYDSITGKEKDEKEYQSLNSKLRKIPVVKGFIAGDTASKTVDEFYDSKAKANTDYTDAKFKYSDTKMTPKQEKELEYLKSVNSLYNKAYNDMKDIEDQIDDVSKSNRSNEYKKNMLEKLKKQKDKIAEETPKEADKLKAKNTLITQAEQRAKLKK